MRRMCMYPQQIHQYVRQFFNETNCEVVEESDSHMHVQLTIELDKKIMNRPFYWSYVESTGIEPNPASLTFITDASKMNPLMRGEVIHFGSPRLDQLFQVTRELGSFVYMYEKTGQTLTPWLGVNYKVTYRSDRTKEMLYSLGMNLLTGAIYQSFQERLNELTFNSTMASDVYHVPYIIQPKNALNRLDAVVEKVVQQDDHEWAKEASERKRKDMLVLDYFYEGVAIKPAIYEVEKKAIEEQYETKITIDVINGGLFYLASS